VATKQTCVIERATSVSDPKRTIPRLDTRWHAQLVFHSRESAVGACILVHSPSAINSPTILAVHNAGRRRLQVTLRLILSRRSRSQYCEGMLTAGILCWLLAHSNAADA